MKIDILMPVHGSPMPQVTSAIHNLIDFSRCKCNVQQLEALSYNPDHQASFHDPAKCPNGKHDIVWQPMVSMSIIHWARNQLIMNSRKEADYVLFCDADIAVDPDALERLLLSRKDIVAGLCTRRTDPAVPNFRAWMDETQNYGEISKWDERETLMEVDAIGTGFMLISRAALEQIAVAYHPESYEKSGNGWWFEFIKTVYDGEWGEDISFCWKAQRIGIPIYVDTSVQPLHYDWYGYALKDYWPYQGERIQTAVDLMKKSQGSETSCYCDNLGEIKEFSRK